MTLRTNTFEGTGSNTDGTVISTANSGGGADTAFNFVGASPEFDTAVVYDGTLAMRCPSSTTAHYVRWNGLNNAQVSGSIYVRFASVAPASAKPFLEFKTSGNAFVANLLMSTTGRIFARDSASATVSGTDIAGHAVSANTWYRIDAACLINPANANAGRLSYRICDVNSGDTNTPINTAFDSGTTLTLGTTNIDRLHVGFPSAVAPNGDYNFDSLRVDDGTFTLMDGLYVAIPITESFTDNLALIEATDGTPPFTIAQDSGTSTTPEELDDGSVSGTGRWLVAKHSADTLVYTVTDAAAVDSDAYNVPPISPANSFIKHPTGSLPSTTWE